MKYLKMIKLLMAAACFGCIALFTGCGMVDGDYEYRIRGKIIDMNFNALQGVPIVIDINPLIEDSAGFASRFDTTDWINIYSIATHSISDGTFNGQFIKGFGCTDGILGDCDEVMGNMKNISQFYLIYNCNGKLTRDSVVKGRYSYYDDIYDLGEIKVENSCAMR